MQSARVFLLVLVVGYAFTDTFWRSTKPPPTCSTASAPTGARCANCHGPDGDVIAGIDLGRGQFRRPMTDEDLVRIIRTGIPNTPMPASNMTVEQASKIVAYLRSRGRGGARRRRRRRCRARQGGLRRQGRLRVVPPRRRRRRRGVGPDLTGIGAGAARAGARARARSTRAPTSQPTNRFYRVVLQDGTTVTGRLLGHDTFTVQLLDTKEQLRSFVKSDLREHGFVDSPMPSYRGHADAAGDRRHRQLSVVVEGHGDGALIDAPFASARSSSLAAAASLQAQVTFDRILHGDREPHNWLSYSGTLHQPALQPAHADHAGQREEPAAAVDLAGAVAREVRGDAARRRRRHVHRRGAQQRRRARRRHRPAVLDVQLHAGAGRRARAAAASTAAWRSSATRCIMGTIDAHLIAIDAKSGQQIWNTVVADAGGPLLDHAQPDRSSRTR